MSAPLPTLEVLCPLCSATFESFRPGVDGRTYLSCPQCQFIQLERAHHLSPQKQKERYLQHDNSRANQGYVVMLQAFIDQAVTPYMKPGGRILDFGSGPVPVLAELLGEGGYSVETYDLFFQKDEAYRDRQYDLVLLVEVLEHLSDPQATLKALVPRLTPGGAISLMTLFHPNDRRQFADWWYRRDPTHVGFFTAKTLEEMGKGLGLTPLFTDSKNLMVLGKSHTRLE